MPKRRKPAPDLNQEVANALGAATQTRVPKPGERWAARDEVKRDPATPKKTTRKH